MSNPRSIRPACGNNPHHQMSDGDRQAVVEFRAYLEARAALRDRIAEALEQADYSGNMRRGDLADAVLPALYQDVPWLRAGVLPAPTDRAAFALAKVQSFCQLVVDQSIRTEAINQARDTLDLIDSAMNPAADVEAQQPEARPTVGYSGKGRVWCLRCPRPDDENVPVDASLLEPYEECAGCKRDVVDVARAQDGTQS